MSHPIREATDDDLPALRAIQLATLAEPWPELLTVALDGPPVALVYDEGGPTGYALVLPGERGAYLVELAVAVPYQGEGRGSALLSALVDRLRAGGYDRLSVTVRATDERAVAFYRGRGFERVERLADHYESGDGHRLVRRL